MGDAQLCGVAAVLTPGWRAEEMSFRDGQGLLTQGLVCQPKELRAYPDEMENHRRILGQGHGVVSLSHFLGHFGFHPGEAGGRESKWEGVASS